MGGANSRNSNNNNRQGQGLFGGGADDSQFSPEMLQQLAQQGQHQYNQRPIEPAPITRNRTTVRNHFALVKNSVRLVKSDENSADKLYHLEFEFSNTKPCNINIYYATTETLDSGARPIGYQAAFEYNDVSFPEERHNRKFSSKSLGLDPIDLSVVDIINLGSKSSYSLVISISSAESNSIASQTTYATASAIVNNEVKLQLRNTKIVVDGHEKAYDVQEIYGIASSNNAEEDNECVVCMCEPRNTTVMPCRHMCLCHDCAEALRKQTNKCPICREPVQSLMRISIDKNIT
jgi:E3 ubiquitin-protein ligase MGRN1